MTTRQRLELWLLDLQSQKLDLIKLADQTNLKISLLCIQISKLQDVIDQDKPVAPTGVKTP